MIRLCDYFIITHERYPYCILHICQERCVENIEKCSGKIVGGRHPYTEKLIRGTLLSHRLLVASLNLVEGATEKPDKRKGVNKVFSVSLNFNKQIL